MDGATEGEDGFALGVSEEGEFAGAFSLEALGIEQPFGGDDEVAVVEMVVEAGEVREGIKSPFDFRVAKSEESVTEAACRAGARGFCKVGAQIATGNGGEMAQGGIELRNGA